MSDDADILAAARACARKGMSADSLRQVFGLSRRAVDDILEEMADEMANAIAEATAQPPAGVLEDAETAAPAPPASTPKPPLATPFKPTLGPWSAKEDARMRKLRADGHSRREIGDDLGRTESDVIQRDFTLRRAAEKARQEKLNGPDHATRERA